MVLLTMLIGLVVVSAWRDALRRDANTWVRHPTALGDDGLLLPGHLPVSLQAEGKIFTLTGGGPVFHRRDDRMFRVATGDQAGFPFTLFTTHESLSAEAEPRLYARKAAHQYVRLRTRLLVPGAVTPPSRPAPVPPEENPFADPAPPAQGGQEAIIPKAVPLGPEEQDSPEEPPPKGTL